MLIRYLQLYYLGLAQRYAGRLTEAIATFERLRSMVPQHTDALFHLGVIYFHQGKERKARERLVDYLQAAPPDAVVQRKEAGELLDLIRERGGQ